MNTFLGKIHISIFPKLVITFMLVLVPLYGMSLSMNESGSKSVKDEITKSMQAQVHFYLKALETDFARIISLQQEYANDEDLQQLSHFYSITSDIEKRNSINRLRSRLNLLKTSSSYIRNAGISITSMDRTLSTDQTIGPIDKHLFRNLSQSTNRFESPFISSEERLYISVPYPEIALQSGPNFIIGVEVDKSAIRSSIGLFMENAEGGAMMIDGRNRWSIVNVPDESLKSPLAGLADELLASDSASPGIRYVKWEGKKMIVTFEKSSRLDAMIVTYLPENAVLSPLQKYRNGMKWLSVVSLILIIVFSYSLFQLIHQPLRTLVRAFKKVEKGSLDGEIAYRYRDEFSYLYIQFNKMIERLKVLIHEVYEQKYRIQRSELRQLQLQINPHFLYNSFFTLYRMTKMEQYEQVMSFTKSLGNYFQFITRDGAQEVLLIDEIQFVRSYVEIQNVRFGRRIHVDFPELPEQWRTLTVPRLIVQPLLENCYKHGLADEDEEGYIRVSYRVEASLRELIVSVEDSGKSLDDDTLHRLQMMVGTSNNVRQDGEGLYNVHRRLQVNYKGRGGLRFSRSPLGGLTAELIVPLDEEADKGDLDHV